MLRSPRSPLVPHVARLIITSAAFATVITRSSGPVCAHPDVRTLTGGNCPSKLELDAAVDRRIKTPIGAPFTLRVRSARGRAMMTLTDGAGVVRVERTVESEDCVALANTVALIVEAFFVEIGAMPFATPPPAPSATTAPAPPPTPSATTAPAPPPAPSATTTPPPPPTPPPATGTSGPAKTDARSLDVLAAAGFELLAGSGVTSFAFAAGLETEWPIARVPMRLELLGTTPTVEAMPDRVRRWAARGMLTTGYRFGTSPSIEPWIGGGVSRAAVRALDLDPAPTTACWSGLVAAGLDATRQIGRGWSLRADAGCSLFLAQEAYRIDPDGEIGRGPRVGCTLTLGAGWSVTTFR